MLALLFSALLTVYVIVPEAIFRFVVIFHISARKFVLTRTETAYRAVLIAFFPFWIAVALTWYVPIANSWPFPNQQNSSTGRRADYKTVASALYSEAEYSNVRAVFWNALTRCARRQARLAFWYFLLIAIEAYVVGRFAAGYARSDETKVYKYLRDRFLAPYISHWPPLLDVGQVQADVLCADGTLYQGTLGDYFLRIDGELSGVVLQGPPRRFNRAQYLKVKDSGKVLNKENYWSEIPSQNLYFLADKILNMNLNYITKSTRIQSLSAANEYLARELSQLAERLGKLRISVGEKPTSTSSGTDSDKPRDE